MRDIDVTTYTTKAIKAPDIARQFFLALEKHGFILAKVGVDEPIRQPYTLENAINAWTTEEDGCLKDGVLVGKTGSMSGSSTKPRFWVLNTWWECPDRVNLNWVSFHIAAGHIDKRKDAIVGLFKDMIRIFEAIYGYIGHDDTIHRQHVPGTLQKRMPGVFWYNYFGPKYVEFFTRDRIVTFPWFSIEEMNGGLITCLSESPKDLLASDELEKKAKVHLGSESFGDVDAYLQASRHNPLYRPEPRKVPELP